MIWINDYAPLLLRICLVVLFPFSALDKIVNWRSAMKQAGEGAAAPAMLVAAIVIEVAAPVCIVLGWHDRLAAFVLAGFCAVTAVLYHQFWRYPEFWRFRPGEGLEHFWEFLKNFGLVGGLGLVMLAPRTLPLTEVAQHPLASTVVSGPEAGAVADQHGGASATNPNTSSACPGCWSCRRAGPPASMSGCGRRSA